MSNWPASGAMWSESSGLIVIPGNNAERHNVEPWRTYPPNPPPCVYDVLLPSPGNGHPSPSDPSQPRNRCLIRSIRFTRGPRTSTPPAVLVLVCVHPFDYVYVTIDNQAAIGVRVKPVEEIHDATDGSIYKLLTRPMLARNKCCSFQHVTRLRIIVNGTKYVLRSDLSRFLSCGGRGSLGENLAIIFREILGRFRFLQLTGDFYKNEGDEGSLETFAEFEERLYDDFIKKINLNVITKRRRSLTL